MDLFFNQCNTLTYDYSSDENCTAQIGNKVELMKEKFKILAIQMFYFLSIHSSAHLELTKHF